jgi:hypothetical protein
MLGIVATSAMNSASARMSELQGGGYAKKDTRTGQVTLVNGG